MAIAARMDGLPSYIYTCIGDGESQEGQIWEAAMLAASHRLDNLIAFTDYNKMQIDGYVEQINGLHPLDKNGKRLAGMCKASMGMTWNRSYMRLKMRRRSRTCLQ